jgi:hypothetical protein
MNSPEYINARPTRELVELCLRSTGFERTLAANIVFDPTQSKFFKPFVTLAKTDADGLLHFSICLEEFEKSQQ